jgi:preprotein translocase subunit SecY
MSSELMRRITFTLGALLVYRLGHQIPLPGYDPSLFFGARGADIEGFRRVSILALGIGPYVSAAILLQLTALVWRRLRTLMRRPLRGRPTLMRLTLYLTVALTAPQSWGIAAAVSEIAGIEADGLFVVSTVLTMTAGTLFLVWLANEITRRGIGNGLALVLLADAVVRLPTVLDATDWERRGFVLAALVLVAAMIAAIAAVELARRNIPIDFAALPSGASAVPPASSNLSFKLNGAGLIPVLVSSWLMGDDFGLGSLAEAFGIATATHLAVTALLTAFIVFVYASFVLDPDKLAENLRFYGGSIPTVEPGEATAAHLDFVLTRLTAFGAAYLVVVCLLPKIVAAATPLQLPFAGPFLLLAACVTLDVMAQARAFAFAGPTNAPRA